MCSTRSLPTWWQLQTPMGRLPTLILWASDDRFLERHVAEAGLALCDDGRLEFVEGASHWLHLEQPERINRRIVEFLGGAEHARSF